jgi:phosphatidyl-myo-inositol dimannoside synthase
MKTKTARIALVTLDYPPERGGVARYLGNLVSASKGEIDVFVPETHDTNGPGNVRTARFFSPFFFHWWPLIGFIRSLKKKGYRDVLISHALPVGTAAFFSRLFCGPRYCILLHGLDLRLINISRRKKWVGRFVLRAANSVFANSEFTASEIRSFDPSLKPVVVTPGVEEMVFPDRSTARRRQGIGENTFLVLSVARLVSRKGIDRLIQSLAHLPSSVRLVVVGDGPERLHLEELSSTYPERVTFIPKATDEERNAWYAAADLFALPARDEGNDVEGFGIVYLEAALAGLPIIAGRSGGIREAVVDQETGLLVDPQDPRAIADAIQSLMDNPAQREEMGRRGRERVQRDFRWEERWSVFEGRIRRHEA